MNAKSIQVKIIKGIHLAEPKSVTYLIGVPLLFYTVIGRKSVIQRLVGI
ncbi:hypothetical protein [Enterococcus gilvus]